MVLSGPSITELGMISFALQLLLSHHLKNSSVCLADGIAESG